MRSAEASRARRRRAAAALAALLLLALVPAAALGASPSPTAAAVGDPRSAGQGPGLVGDPLMAILVVAAIAIASVLATWAWVRATAESRR